jgi:hypothetical protein
VKKWRKYIKLEDARRLSKIFCDDFNIEYCEIYYVDRISGDSWGEYSILTPPHILIVENVPCTIGILMHELTHHIECSCYDGVDIYKDNMHGYHYQLAKQRVIRWCKKNISDKSDWRLVLKGIQRPKELKAFRV